MNNLNDIFFAPAANQDLTYEQILEDVQRYFAENHAATIAEAGDGNTDRASSLLKELMVQYIVKRKYAIEGLTTEELCEKLYEDMAGYSFLKKWIYKPGIEEVNINAYNDIEVIEAGGRSVKIPDKFSSPQHAMKAMIFSAVSRSSSSTDNMNSFPTTSPPITSTARPLLLVL